MKPEDQGRAFEELKNLLESKGQHLSETKEKMEKIEADLDKHEVQNQKLVQQMKADQNAALEMKEKIEALEKQLFRMPAGRGSVDQEEEKKQIKNVLNTFYRCNNDVKTQEQKDLEKTISKKYYEEKFLRTDSDPSGGYLAPFEYYQEILKKITEISPVRSVARILPTSRESLHIPVRESLVAGTWTGEGNNFPASNSTYGIREIKVNSLSVSTVSTIQMIQDSVFNIEAQITSDITESFAQTEGQAFVLGNGVAKPEGILANSGNANGPQIVNSGVANGFDGDSLIDIAGELKTGYNPAYMLNRRSLAFVRRLKDGLGQYLWTPGIANSYPSMINGYPYINAIDVPDVAADATPVIFGDFYRGYVIVDHVMMYLVRDPYTQSASGKIVFNAIRRVGGQVVLAEAIKVLKCSV